MKDVLITQLRDKNSSIEAFRSASDKLADILAYESGSFITKYYQEVISPIGPSTGVYFSKSIFLLPILRSGLVFLPAFLKYYIRAKVGFLGVKRDEKTFNAYLYYEKLCGLEEDDTVLILDPMLATGGSADLAIELLKNKGIKESNIKLIGIIASEEGLSFIKKQHPLIETLIATVDKDLSDQKYIKPGLGDFGDRYFGSY
jgi:uracil phosphoribosyltransferase